MTGTRPALVLDFGGPVLLTPFELMASAERRLGLPPGSLPWRGPFDPGSDAEWRDVLSGALAERRYWANRAAEFASLTGRRACTRELIGTLYGDSESTLIWEGARALIADAGPGDCPSAFSPTTWARFTPRSGWMRSESCDLPTPWSTARMWES
ncbi:MAG: hypothetical protein ACM3ML_27980 [Micromonosporaceae bacterium]